MIYKFKFENYIYFLAIIIYSLTAFFSIGYFNADEHYQIIEFAGLLDGTTTPIDLPWEYERKIRPAIQPILTYIIFEVLSFFSLTDPYIKTFILRLITALVSIIIIIFFTKSCQKFLSPKNWKLFLLLSFFLWFLPFINIRFSSETWSGLLFLLSIAIILNDKNNHYKFALIGLIIGFSFLFRYQIAFAVFGIFLWLIFIKREQISKIVVFSIGFLCILFLGFLIDSWFYNEWTFTTYNYFNVNIIEDKASEFGVSPWYNYILLVLIFSFPPFGIIILATITLFVNKNHKSLITWAIVPFFIIHSMVAHKEIRFLFPIINFVPFIIVKAFEDSIFKMNWYKKNKKIIYKIFIFLFVINIFCLGFASFRPVGKGRAGIVEKIHYLNNKPNLNIFITKDYNPKYRWLLNSNFYKEENANFINIDTLSLSKISFEKNKTRNVLITSINDIEEDQIKKIIKQMKMKEITKTFPNFSFHLFKKINMGDKVFLLYSD